MDDLVHDRLKPILVWALLLGFSTAWRVVAHGPEKLLLQLLPVSIFALNMDFLRGLALTFGASLIAWGIGVIGGLLVGIAVASTVVDPKKQRRIISLGSSINMMLTAFYIIPFVLTVSLFFSLVSSAVLNRDWARYTVVVVMISIAGMVLGGYQVYGSVYESVVKARDDSRILCNTLFYRTRHPYGNLLRTLTLVSRLQDCEIFSLWKHLELAAHLSIVSVMIVETIVPHFYEWAFPSAGLVRGWDGGTGLLIVRAQQSLSFQEIAGCIWIVLLFDWVWTSSIDSFSRWRWRKYYAI